MQTIVVGLSGGVDSAVAAFLLKRQGHNVIGVFMKNWEEKSADGVCTSEADAHDAQAVAEKIGIPFHVVNFTKEYKENVFKEFLSDIAAGLTPNPDVLCNREIKFGPLLDFAKKIGADKLATGHYANILEENGVFQLQRCIDDNKDQTYFLCELSEEQLRYACFPLAALDKKEVRKIASQQGFAVAQKKDSTGICFIGERNFKNFLSSYVKGTKGDIVTTSGVKIGEHDGLCFYTIGQKKGLAIGGVKGFEGASFCVVDKDAKTNRLIVAADGTDAVLSYGLAAQKFNFTGKKYKGQHKLTARFRHRQPLQSVTAVFEDGGIKVIFDEPQRAITKGQFAVLYDGKNVVGGGKITDVSSGH